MYLEMRSCSTYIANRAQLHAAQDDASNIYFDVAEWVDLRALGDLCGGGLRPIIGRPH